jgi:hypothetical protein
MSSRLKPRLGTQVLKHYFLWPGSPVVALNAVKGSRELLRDVLGYSRG